ncbi:MAG: hypothetical protein FWG61_01105, partial [Firmicutes bacterium]|nr:hypothetical protein [Bacillota bacterium]
MKQTRMLFIGFIITLILIATPLLSALAQDNMPPPLDPQSWKLQRDMAWNEWKPNPYIDWIKDDTVEPARVLRGVLVLVDFPDRSFLVTEEKGSDILGNPVIGGIAKEDLADFWRDYLTVPSAANNYVTLDAFWKENTYGRQTIELEACGPYTLSRFEFQYGSLGITTVQRFDSIFPRGTAMATEAYNLAKASGDIKFFADGKPAYDFVFFIHAGYDPSGLWQEVGEMMFLTRNDIAKEFSGLAKLETIENELTAPGFDLASAYPGFYMFTKPTASAEITNFYNSYKEVFFAKAYAAAHAADPALTESAFETNVFRPEYNVKFADDASYKNMVPDILRGHLLRAKNAANTTSGNTWMQWAATRYVPWTAWFSSMVFWTTEGTVRDAEYNYTWDVSTQAESDGMATFAHEFGHIRSLPDNYNAPFTLPMTRSYTGPWELMSRGSFGGPGGNHQRYQIPAVMGGSVPPNQILDARMENLFTAEEDLVNVTVNGLIANGPVIADIVARNIPTNNSNIKYGVEGYRGLKITGFADATPRDNNTLDPNNNTGGNLMDYPDAPRAKIDPAKWNWGTFRNSPRLTHDSYTIEVVDRTGFDSFMNDHGVLISKHASARQNYQPNSFIIDAHPGPLGIVDFIRPNGDIAGMTDGDQLQLVAALFHAGVHNNPKYADTFTGNQMYGSLFGGEYLNKPIITTTAGNVVNEWIDEYNQLHFYILDKITNPAANGSYLSYQVAVRSFAATAAQVGGDLVVDIASIERETPTKVAIANFTITNTGGAADIIRVKAEGDINPVLLNNLFAVEAGQTITVPVYMELPGDIRTKDLSGKTITLTASSETNNAKIGSATIKASDLIAYNYNVYLVPDQSGVYAGETVNVDLMLSGDINYTQISAEIAYDTNLLKYEGYTNLAGIVAAVSPLNGKVSVRSVPSLNMVFGEPCAPEVKIVTLKFTALGNFSEDKTTTALGFASIFVNPPAGSIGAGTAPGEKLPLIIYDTIFTKHFNKNIELYPEWIGVDAQGLPTTMPIFNYNSAGSYIKEEVWVEVPC